MAEYANPDVLVSTEWVQENLGKDGIKIIESNEDILLYDIGHIEGAIKLDWETELQDKLVRDYIDKDNFEKLMSSKEYLVMIQLFFMAIKAIGGHAMHCGHLRFMDMKNV